MAACRSFIRKAVLAAGMVLAVSATPALAQSCGNDGAGLDRWLASYKQSMSQQGISSRTLQTALGNVSYNSEVIRLDRNQRSFKLSLDESMQRRAPASFVKRGQGIIRDNARLLNAIEKQYGVPKEILVAIWGMETGFGSNSGNMNIFRSRATLAYDCRRSDYFTEQLYAALKLIDREDLDPNAVGAMHGEIGQTQFLPVNVLKYGVDGDGSGHIDMARSKADALYSTANFLVGHGWRRGAGYQPGEANYGAIQGWNAAQVYQRAIAVMGKAIDE